MRQRHHAPSCFQPAGVNSAFIAPDTTTGTTHIRHTPHSHRSREGLIHRSGDAVATEQGASEEPGDGDGTGTDVTLRLLHVTLGGGNSNGIRKAVAELTYALASLGHHVLLHLSGADQFDDYPGACGRSGVQTVTSELSGPAAFGYSRAGERWIESPAAASCSVLHQHGIWPAYSRLTRRWRAAHGRATIVAPQGALEPVSLEGSRWKKALALTVYERRNLHDATCLQATAEQEIAGFRDFGLKNPVAIIPNGVSDQWIGSTGDGGRFRVAHGLPPGVPMLLYMSRIHPKKNLLGLVDAIARLRGEATEWHLIVGGPVEERAYHARVLEAIDLNGLGARVHWVGELQGQDKRDAFAAAQLFVLPTLSDNFAIVVAEALGAGVPVITTQGALPWSLLETHGCGWWVPLTTSHLVDALQQAAHMSPAQRADMGRRGRTLVEQQFRWADIARRTTQLYRWLLGQAAQPDFVVLD